MKESQQTIKKLSDPNSKLNQSHMNVRIPKDLENEDTTE